MQKITPFLWFDDNLEDAVKFYTSIFKNSTTSNLMPGPGEKLMSATFQLEGQEFIALNGGPIFKFTEAISFFIKCDTQKEIDEMWEKLSEGGEKSRCGWLKDKFGLSWQVVPPVLGQMLSDADREKAGRVMQAMMKMDKIILADLHKAYDGK